MDKYFIYNKNPLGAKYVEISKDEFLRIWHEPGRWFINFGNCVLECEKSEYRSYYRVLYHYRYTKRTADFVNADVVSLSGKEDDCTYDMSIFSQHNERGIEDIVIERIYQEFCKQRLIAALETLSSDEVYLVQEMTLKSRKQKDLAAELGISQQAVSKKYLAAMRKLRQLLSDLEG